MATPRAADEALHRALLHEVGNLLAAIRLSAHLLADTDDASERRRGAVEIERLSAQAGELLALVRPLRAVEPGRRVRVAVADVLAAASRAFDERDAPGAPLTVRPAPRGIPDVRVDPDALHHTLLVLVRAALQAGARRRVELAAGRRGGCVVFEVSDDGARLPAKRPVVAGASRGRELAVRLAAAALRRDRGRVEGVSSARGTRVRVALPASPRRGGGA
jgi:nitrogen-specific signal transduction histidine kinase